MIIKIKNFILTQPVKNAVIQGITGRTMIGEFLYISEKIMEKIEREDSVREIEREGIKEGMTSLILNGIEKAILGITSLDELIREC